MTSSRIPPLYPEYWTDEVRAVCDLSVPPTSPYKGVDFNSVLMMAQHPELTKLWYDFNNLLSAGVTIPTRIKEIAILRVAYRYGSDYEWIQHVISGVRIGLTNAHFVALKGDPADAIWADEERAVIRFADDLCDRREVSAPVWADVARHFDAKQAVELLYVMGAYQLLGFMFNTAGVRIEPFCLDAFQKIGAPHVGDSAPQAVEPPKPA